MRTLPLTIAFLGAAALAAGWALRPAQHEDAAARADEGVPLPTEAPPADPWLVPQDVPSPVLYFDRWESLTTKDGLPSDRTTCVVAEGDDLFVGTEHGFAMRRAGAWTTYGHAEGIPHGYITAIARDPAADITWLGTLKGLVRIAGGQVDVFTQRTSGLQNDVVYHVVVDGPRLWCATAAGGSVLDTRTGSWSLFDQDNTIMHEPWCYSIALGPERAWYGIWAGGIAELNRRTGTWKEYRDPDGELEIDLLKDDGALHEVTSFTAYDAGLLWQATYFGVARFDGHSWRSYTAKDEGTPGDFVLQLAGLGRACYLATDQGFGVIGDDGETCVSYKRTPDGKCTVRTVVRGHETDVRTYATAPADDSVMWVAPQGRDIWVATSRGLSHGFGAAK